MENEGIGGNYGQYLPFSEGKECLAKEQPNRTGGATGLY
jgi:hypothetical protein